jgi:ComF family protein
MLALVDRALEALLSLAAPPTCIGCDQSCRYLLCAACARERRAPAARSIDGVPVVAALKYAPPFDRVIQRFKYESRPDLARALAALLLPLPELSARVLIPVPLHPRRLAERGYNQAALLARELARSSRLVVEPRALIRVTDTPRQATLAKSARLANVAGAFRARDPAQLAGRPVALVDDVVTTGATLLGCIRALREAGAEVSAVISPAVTGT